MTDVKCEYIMIYTSFNNKKGYSLYKICMSTYFIAIVSILIYYSKNMSSKLKHSLSSLSPSDDELKPSISTTGDNVHLQAFNGVQWVMGGYILRGVIECMKVN